MARRRLQRGLRRAPRRRWWALHPRPPLRARRPSCYYNFKQLKGVVFGRFFLVNLRQTYTNNWQLFPDIFEMRDFLSARSKILFRYLSLSLLCLKLWDILLEEEYEEEEEEEEEEDEEAEAEAELPFHTCSFFCSIIPVFHKIQSKIKRKRSLRSPMTISDIFSGNT